MASNPAPNTRILASGRVAFVTGPRGVAQLACPWLVQVPSNNPEPDSPADLYMIVPCDAPLYAPEGNLDRTVCSNGHEHLAYGSVAQRAQEAMEALLEAAASTDPNLAAVLDGRP
jgi:hypothetical protein